jgi:hypothetical protein
MIGVMFLAHLLGDYVFQTDTLARWKARSAWGVLAHGAIVTLCTWLCSLPFDPGWWPWALLIGVTHAGIDWARVSARVVGPAAELALFAADQACHAGVIGLALYLSGWLGERPAETALGLWLQGGDRLALASGYVLLSMPAWVMVHFLVHGAGAVSKSLPGKPGEKYLGMIERGLIATLVLLGQFLLVPLVVVPRLMLDARGLRAEEERIGYLSELLLSVSLAVGVGVALRARLY